MEIKTKDIILWSIIGLFFRNLIIEIARVAMGYAFVPLYLLVNDTQIPAGRPEISLWSFHIPGLIIFSLIDGLILGLILVKVYPQIQKINQKVFKGWFNSIFRLIFYPIVIWGILVLFVTGAAYGVVLDQFSLVTIFAQILGTYVFARLMDRKLSKYHLLNHN